MSGNSGHLQQVLTVPRAMSMSEAVEFHRSRGLRVESRKGRHWVVNRRRFWLPLQMATPSYPADPGWPAVGAQAYYTPVSEAQATAHRPAVVVPDLHSYCETRIRRDRRREVRRAQERLRFDVLDDPGILQAQGGTGDCSSKWSGGFDSATPPLVIAALDGPRLVGHMVSYAVGNEVLVEDLRSDPTFRSAHTDTALYWLTLSAWARNPVVDRAWLGGQLGAHGAGVDSFKYSLGGVAVDVPVAGGVRSYLRPYLRRRRPHMSWLHSPR